MSISSFASLRLVLPRVNVSLAASADTGSMPSTIIRTNKKATNLFFILRISSFLLFVSCCGNGSMLKMAAPLDFFDAARRAEAPSSGGWHTCSVFYIIPYLPSARKGFCARRAGKFWGGGCGFASGFSFSPLPAATSQSASLTAPLERGALGRCAQSKASP